MTMTTSAGRVAAFVIFVTLMTGVAVGQEKPAHGASGAAKAAEPAAAQHGEKSGAEAKPEKAETQEGPSAELAEASREAEGGEEENAEFKLSPSVRWVASHTGLSAHGAYWLLYSLDFLIIAVVIGWAWKANLPAMFRSRTESIRKTMAEAERTSADATRRLSEIEGRLAKLDAEIAGMRASADNDAAVEEQRIRAAADEDARKIVDSAEQEIQAAARLAQRELKAYAAELAVSMAERRIQVDATTDRALVQSFVGQLGSTNDGAAKERS